MSQSSHQQVLPCACRWRQHQSKKGRGIRLRGRPVTKRSDISLRTGSLAGPCCHSTPDQARADGEQDPLLARTGPPSEQAGPRLARQADGAGQSGSPRRASKKPRAQPGCKLAQAIKRSRAFFCRGSAARDCCSSVGPASTCSGNARASGEGSGHCPLCWSSLPRHRPLRPTLTSTDRLACPNRVDGGARAP